MTSSHLLERIGPSVLFAVLPLATTLATIPAYLLIGNEEGVLLRIVLLVSFWAVGAAGVVGLLRRNWSGESQHPTWSLAAAATAALLGLIASGQATEQWQDLMSLPQPTPLMVALDVTATFLPFITAAGCAWVVLMITGRPRGLGA